MKRLALVLVALAAVVGAARPWCRPASSGATTASSPLPCPCRRRRRPAQHLLVADLHADTLLWDRDLLARGSTGHVDVPRLKAGGVGLQAFTG